MFFRYVKKALDALLLPFMHGTPPWRMARCAALWR
jgi:hypothetical protein